MAINGPIYNSVSVRVEVSCPICGGALGLIHNDGLDLSYIIKMVADHVMNTHTPQTGELQVALRANKELSERNSHQQDTAEQVLKELADAGVVGGSPWGQVRELRRQRDEAQRSLYTANEKITQLVANAPGNRLPNNPPPTWSYTVTFYGFGPPPNKDFAKHCLTLAPSTHAQEVGSWAEFRVGNEAIPTDHKYVIQDNPRPW